MEAHGGPDRLEEILHTRAQARALLTRVLHAKSSRLLVRGPSGSGKSTLADYFAESAGAARIAVLRLSGDPARSSELHYPLKAIFRSGGLANLFDMGAKVVTAITDDFLPIGRSAVKAVTALVAQESKKAFGYDESSTDVSRKFIVMLTRWLQSRSVIIIADDIQYFDQGTLILLNFCVDAKVNPSGNKGRLHILSILNTDVAVPETMNLRRLLLTLDVIEKRYCDKSRFGDLLRGFGYDELPPQELLDSLYDLSGGHLQVVKAIAEDLRGRPASELDVATRNELLRLTIERRISRCAIDFNPVADLLEPAAVIGNSFSVEEISCLTQLDRAALARRVDQAASMHLVQAGGSTIRFSHEILRDFFADRGTSRRNDYLAKLAECLRVLRPADYFARCLVLLDAHRPEAACVAYCQGQLSEWRSGRHHGGVLPSSKLQRLDLAGVRDFLNAINEASTLLIEGDYISAQDVLRSTDDSIDLILRAERDYLLAEALLKDLGTSKTQEALTILERHASLRDIEPELWCRSWLLLLLANVQLERYDEAAKVDRTIAAFLAGRAKFDGGAELQLQRLLALSEMHTTAEISRRRLAQACDHHARELAAKQTTDMREYFICLTNKSGNSITTRNFGDAKNEALRALAIAMRHSMLEFPARWAPANNALVASVLDIDLSPDAAARSLRMLLERFPSIDDDILLCCNIGGLEILDGGFGAALAVIKRAAERIAATGDIDPFYQYLCESNEAIGVHLSGGSSGMEQWDRSAALIPRLGPAVRHDLAARYKALREVFATAPAGDARSWDAALTIAASSLPRFSARRFPRGVFLTDIQIWSSY